MITTLILCRFAALLALCLVSVRCVESQSDSPQWTPYVGHSAAVLSVAFAAQDVLVSVDADATVIEWDLRKGKDAGETVRLSSADRWCSSEPCAAALSHQGHRLAIASGADVAIYTRTTDTSSSERGTWNKTGGRPVVAREAREGSNNSLFVPSFLVFDQDYSSLMLVVDAAHNSVAYVPLSRNEVLQGVEFELPTDREQEAIGAVAFVSNGAQVLVAVGNRVILWNPQRNSQSVFYTFTSQVTALHASRNEIIVGQSDGTVELLEIKSQGNSIHRCSSRRDGSSPQSSPAPVTAVAFLSGRNSRSGPIAVTGDSQGFVALWRVEDACDLDGNGTLVVQQMSRAHLGPVVSIAVHSGSVTTVASCGRDGTVVAWGNSFGPVYGSLTTNPSLLESVFELADLIWEWIYFLLTVVLPAVLELLA